ncbi:hypothetical protein MTR67_023679 [Solanum verrucosum]|uniref:Uncharacterized protein n=1 Tax=Solanum verrucosum TaxID=315347 RepID=A0AAF0TSD5_SOLVR|nr:hypothetical protein MTR67_023679 [Solanum verrucosum]
MHRVVGVVHRALKVVLNQIVTLCMHGIPLLVWTGVDTHMTKVSTLLLLRQFLKEFADVFPTDLPSLSPNRDIEFGVDVESRKQPVSILPYHMDPT